MPDHQAIAARLAERLGSNGFLREAGDIAPFRRDSVYCAEGDIIGVARPANLSEVSDVLALCHDAGIVVIPRGGGTGFAGGALPRRQDSAVILSTDRLRAIRSVDIVGDVMVVEAGVTLQAVRDEAARHGRLVGIDHGGAGSSAIGGNIATNAGGNNVVRYGMSRDQLLGIEAVLSDGRLVSSASTLRKSNAGYDLRHLLAGSEGTLAIITAVALKMRPQPVKRVTGLFALASPDAVLTLFAMAKDVLGEAIAAFEVMSQAALAQHYAHAGASAVQPFANDAKWSVLIEADAASVFFDLDAALAALTERALEMEIVRNGILAASLAQRDALWKLREGIAVAMGAWRGPMVRTDTSVPVARVPEFIAGIEAGAQRIVPGAPTFFFGHVGDGNIHFNLAAPPSMPDETFRARMSEVYRMTEDMALSLNGSVSAEHGIGQSKREALMRMKTPVELDLMAGIKKVFDPGGLLNPGKILF
jgi:FAD/FMN-containing dehydrogenase